MNNSEETGIFTMIKYVLSALLMLSLTNVAPAKQTLKMGYIEFPPAYYTDKSGTPNGPIIQMARAIAKEANYQLNVETLPTNRLIRHINDGKIDLWLGLKTMPGFENTTHMGTEVLRTIELTLYSKSKFSKVTRPADLAGKRVIILRGYSYGGWTKIIKAPNSRIKYYETVSHESALQMLKEGRADYLLDYAEAVELALKNVPVKPLKQQIIANLPCYLVISKKTPNGDKVLQDLERAFLRLKKRNGDKYLKW